MIAEKWRSTIGDTEPRRTSWGTLDGTACELRLSTYRFRARGSSRYMVPISTEQSDRLGSCSLSVPSRWHRSYRLPNFTRLLVPVSTEQMAPELQVTEVSGIRTFEILALLPSEAQCVVVVSLRSPRPASLPLARYMRGPGLVGARP